MQFPMSSTMPIPAFWSDSCTTTLRGRILCLRNVLPSILWHDPFSTLSPSFRPTSLFAHTPSHPFHLMGLTAHALRLSVNQLVGLSPGHLCHHVAHHRGSGEHVAKTLPPRSPKSTFPPSAPSQRCRHTCIATYHWHSPYPCRHSTVQQQLNM